MATIIPFRAIASRTPTDSQHQSRMERIQAILSSAMGPGLDEALVRRLERVVDRLERLAGSPASVARISATSPRVTAREGISVRPFAHKRGDTKRDK